MAGADGPQMHESVTASVRSPRPAAQQLTCGVEASLVAAAPGNPQQHRGHTCRRDEGNCGPASGGVEVRWAIK